MEVAIRWSPHSTDDQRRFLLVDIANPSVSLNEVDSCPDHGKGRVNYHEVARHSKLPAFNAFDWSKTDESIVALGLANGSANLIRLQDHEFGGSAVLATYRIKQERKCNSIAFNSQNLLAVAVDRPRNDVGLLIYDTTRDESVTAPVRRLCAAELVSSVRFFPSTPNELVVGAARTLVRLHDLRDSHTGPTGNVQASTRNVNNLAVDPLDENYFASAGSTDDPSVTVWDRRRMISSTSNPSAVSNPTAGAVLDFRPALNSSVKTTVWSLKYSGRRRGCLALCSSTGELKVINMADSPASSAHVSESPGLSITGDLSSTRYVSEARLLEQPYHHSHNGRDAKARIVAYDWVSETTHSAQPIITVRQTGEVELLRVPFARPTASITNRQDLSVAFDGITITEPKTSPEQSRQTVRAPYEQVRGIDPEDFGPLDYEGEGDSGSSEAGLGLVCDRDSSRIGRILASGTLQRERCRRGYLFDCCKNIELVAGNWQLERLWEIIDRFQEQALDDGMVWGHLDLSFVGIAGLWSENVGSSPHRRLSHSPAKPAKAIVGLNATKAIPAFEGERTHFPEHRQLCLAVCGWKFTVDTLEAECNELIERGLYYQAIVQAVLHDYKHIALNILRTLIRSKTIQNIGLGALLATDEINEEQREMCLWMAADTDDPALKALLTFLTTGDWRDVMKTNYLHLGYRLALGLKYLNDTELSGFIQSETARAVRNGDLEGILLTGLGEQAMDLFQTYLTRTNDLQTAVLATAFTNPKYVDDDIRWEMWKETYFAQMQSWRLFAARAKFTVLHNRMATTRDGKGLLPKAQSAIELRCLHCQGSLAHTEQELSESSTRIAGPAAAAGTVCLQCGRHMPRCGICQLWLGTPRSAKDANASTSANRPKITQTNSEDNSTKETSNVDEIMAKLLTFCIACGHGFHADHAAMWFRKWEICPVPDCSCLCAIK